MGFVSRNVASARSWSIGRSSIYGDFYERTGRRISRLSMLWRIAIGNAVIIVLGAIGGTLLTRLLTGRTNDAWLIAFFATVGITLSVATNSWIIRTALRPLHELRILTDGLESDGPANMSVFEPLLQGGDPDIRRLAASIQSMVKKLDARSRRLRALSKRCLCAQEEERKRIARSLHDDTGQGLTRIMIALEQVEQRLPPSASEARASVVACRQQAASNLSELRHLIYGLRPSILDDLGLGPAIRWYARNTLEPSGIRVEVELPENGLPLPADTNTNLFRITQEAISNIVRHAHAGKARIALSSDGHEVCLEIADDGRGFVAGSSARPAQQLQHLGLLGIQERAQQVGGMAQFESSPGCGTIVRVSVPISPSGVEMSG